MYQCIVAGSSRRELHCGILIEIDFTNFKFIKNVINRIDFEII